MVIAAKDILKWTDNSDRESFAENELLLSAVLRKIEVIGQASKALSDDFKAAHPEFDWDAPRRMRNKVLYDYREVDPLRVWEVVKQDLPDLLRLLEPLVPSEEEG